MNGNPQSSSCWLQVSSVLHPQVCAATRVNGITLPPTRSSDNARVPGARACERRYPDVEVELIIKQ